MPFTDLALSYATLPAALHSRVAPLTLAASQQPVLRLLNRELARELGFDPVSLETDKAVQTLAGYATTNASGKARTDRWPLAQAYAGHQFGQFTVLGDGRAVLLGEKTTVDGRLVDIQLKGVGPTPYARRGDGRAALAPMLREYLISEAMHAFGVPTTRSLAVVETGQPVYRERVLPGAVLTRVAASHIRVGTFQYAAMQDVDVLRALADYTIQRHDPDLTDAPNPYLGLLNRVIERQAALIAHWMLVGFVHGVMNTDNVSIAGETLDYGPCAFIDAFDPTTVFSSIDRQGRYAYGNQPAIAHWNVCRFAESLLPLLAADADAALTLAESAIARYAGLFEAAWRGGLASKIGFVGRSEVTDQLGEELLNIMQTVRADYTQTFRALLQPDALPAVFANWRARWRQAIAAQPGGMTEARARMAAANPIVIPRNHWVQAALDAAETGDLAPFMHLLAALQTPYESAHEGSLYAAPVADSAPYVTYCGT